MPLALYQTSYLSTADSHVPDGGAWTWAKVAMVPCYHGTYNFNSTSSTVTLGFVNSFSPLGFAMSNHSLWHSSIRMQFNFFCATFISGRILINFYPNGVTSVQQIDSNLTRIVDVKGDTTVQITFPWINPTDFRNVANISTTPQTMDFGPATIELSVYNDIVSSDASLDPNIDLVVWAAAAPDCQFSNLFFTGSFGNGTDSVSRRFRPQCDIQENFTRTFPPFVKNCTIYTDQHYCTSEVTDRLADVLKRYQTAVPYAETGSALVADANFQPATFTISWAIHNAFVFRRGGVLYKGMVAVIDDTVAGPTYANYVQMLHPIVTASGPYAGQPSFRSSITETALSFAIPWYEEVPYFPQSEGSVNSASWTFESAGTTTNSRFLLTAVRDDYELGWLVCPNDSSTLKRRVKQRRRCSQGVPSSVKPGSRDQRGKSEAEYKPASSPQQKAVPPQSTRSSIGKFVGLG